MPSSRLVLAIELQQLEKGVSKGVLIVGIETCFYYYSIGKDDKHSPSLLYILLMF